jgi:hypothetical protein
MDLRKEFLLFFLFTFLTVNVAQAKAKSSVPVPSVIWGTWSIAKYIEVGGHGAENETEAKNEIGRKITFSKAGIKCNYPFLYYDKAECIQAKYKFQIDKYDQYEAIPKGTLFKYSLDPIKNHQTQQIIITCEGGNDYYFELAQNNRLTVYYDGWFFYLEKIK